MFLSEQPLSFMYCANNCQVNHSNLQQMVTFLHANLDLINLLFEDSIFEGFHLYAFFIVLTVAHNRESKYTKPCERFIIN